jgi:hypothetical protein
MRIITAGLLSLAAMTGSAAASSFVTFGETAPTSTPSIVMLGAPDPIQVAATEAAAPDTAARLDPSQQALLEMIPGSWQQGPVVATAADVQPRAISPSVIALGEPSPETIPGVAYEKVAAISTKAKTRSNFSPMVIRGGVVGDAFVPSQAPAADTPQASAEASSTPPANAPAAAPEPVEANRPPAPEPQ